MADRENREQTEKIAELLGCDFGVCDTEGNVIYSGTGAIPAGTRMKVPAANDEFAGLEGETPYYFLKRVTEGNQTVWLFMRDGADEKTARRLLELAGYAYDSHEASRKKKKNELFRTLLLNGYAQVNAEELNSYGQYIGGDAEGYAVVMTSADNSETELTTLVELIEGIFPPAEGYITVPTDTEKICTICPISGGNTFDALEENAMLIKDTILSELMTKADVSVGVQVAGLKNIDYAYKTADRACMIGKVFELPQKCFVYDKLGLYRVIYGQPKENCTAYLREIFGKQMADELTSRAGNASTDEIVKTIETFLKFDQNISETSKALFIHRNTLIYRLEKFNKATGLDCARFEDGMKVGMALLILKYYNKRFDTNG